MVGGLGGDWATVTGTQCPTLGRKIREVNKS